MQIKTDYKRPVIVLLNRFNDIRFVGQAIFVLIVLLISWSGVKSIQTNYNLQKQISKAKLWFSRPQRERANSTSASSISAHSQIAFRQ